MDFDSIAAQYGGTAEGSPTPPGPAPASNFDQIASQYGGTPAGQEKPGLLSRAASAVGSGLAEAGSGVASAARKGAGLLSSLGGAGSAVGDDFKRKIDAVTGTADYISNTAHEIANPRAPQNQVEVPERSWGDVASDTGKDFIGGLGQATSALGVTAGMLTGNMENSAAAQRHEAQNTLDSVSPALKAMRYNAEQNINAQQGWLPQAVESVKQYVKHPSLALDFSAQQIPNYLYGAAAGRGTGLLSRLLGAGEETAGKLATGAAVATGGAMQGADAGGGSYDQLMALPEKTWEQIPQYRDAQDKAQAKHDIALNLARGAFAASGGLSMLLNTLPGATRLEKTLAGVTSKEQLAEGLLKRGLKTGAIETATEGTDEGVGQFLANLAVQQVDPNQDLSEGVGENAGLGALMGPLGGITEMAEGLGHKPAQPQNQPGRPMATWNDEAGSTHPIAPNVSPPPAGAQTPPPGVPPVTPPQPQDAAQQPPAAPPGVPAYPNNQFNIPESQTAPSSVTWQQNPTQFGLTPDGQVDSNAILQASQEGRIIPVIPAPATTPSTPNTPAVPQTPAPAHATDNAMPEAKEEPKTQSGIGGQGIHELPLDALKLSEDVPNFKSGANGNGVVEPLGGKFDRTGVAPIQVWRRNDGSLEVISGRHRLDLARRSGEQTIPAQIHNEADGFNAAHASTLDAELNIRDGQGKVKDYVQYFQATGISREEAAQRGLTERPLGRRAYEIAVSGSPEVIAAHRNDSISDEAAYGLAVSAPGNAALQAAGLKALQEGKSVANAVNLIHAIKALGGGQGNETGDLFGFDDSEMKRAAAMAKVVSEKQRDLQKEISAINGAAKNPGLAKQHGIDVSNPEAVLNRVNELKAEKQRWDNWSSHPDLVNQVVEAIGGNPNKQTEQAPVEETKTQQEGPGLFDEPAAPEEKKGPQKKELEGASPEQTELIANEFKNAEEGASEDNFQIHHLFDDPKKNEIVKIEKKATLYHAKHGWMTPEKARAKVEEWKAHAAAQYEDGDIRSENSKKVVLSLFDRTGEWSKPWAEAGYNVFTFDIQNEEMNHLSDPNMQGDGKDINTGDVNNFSVHFFDEMYGNFDGMDIHAILAACPCTDFSSSGARHFAAKDADGRTVESVKLVHQTLATIEHFRPAVWAIENPVGRIEKLGDLPPWRASFQPNDFGDPYTKRTLLWGRFNADMPVAPVEPTEGSKMHDKLGGGSLETKNARSVTPEGFAYAFFMANNAHDNRALTLANKYDRLDPELFKKAVEQGLTDEQIKNAVDDPYYFDIDDEAAADALKEAIYRQMTQDGQETKTEQPQEEQKPEETQAPKENAQAEQPSEKEPESQQAEEKAQETSNKTGNKEDKGKITDFGEKIEGAAKYRDAYAQKMKDAMEEDIASVKFSQSWPEPDYQKLLEDGTPIELVSMVRSLREAIPDKPRKKWKLESWADLVESLRDVSNKILSKNDAGKRLKVVVDESISKSELLRNLIQNKAELYNAVGHESSLRDLKLVSHSYTFFNGVKYNPAKTFWSVEKEAKSNSLSNFPRQIVVAESKEDAIRQFKEKYEAQKNENSDESPKEKDASFNIFHYRSQKDVVYIGKKLGKEMIALMKFNSVKEAREYLENNKQELIKRLEEYKKTMPERRISNEPRVGIDHRNGANVTPEQFMETFGFRGGQFGTSLLSSQKEAQAHLNEAYDALLDMAGIIGIPPQALSLNGELAIAFGARGRGGKNAASAHYEPDRRGVVGNNDVVINLTRKNGAGALAHEWFHALDNYFARMRNEKTGYITNKPGNGNSSVRPEVEAAFLDLMRKIRETSLKERSKELDKRKTKPYWHTPIEMAARAFESYVIEKLKDKNQSNDYLANIVDQKAWDSFESTKIDINGESKKTETYPYPITAEMPIIRAAFDNLFNVIETKETDKGTALYSIGEASTDTHTVESLKSSLSDALGERLVNGLLNTGKFKIITSTEAESILGERMNSQPDDLLNTYTADDLARMKKEEADRLKKEAADKKKQDQAATADDFTLTGSDREVDQAAARGQLSLFSQNGEARAFYNPADGTTYLIADNIPTNFSADELRGLMRHEIGVHALNVGRDSEGWQKILKQVEGLVRLGHKAALEAKRRAEAAGTKPEHMLEEIAGYLVENAPQTSVVRRIIAWFKDMVHKVTGFQMKLTPEDIVAMAESALKNAPKSFSKNNSDENSFYFSKDEFKQTGNRPNDPIVGPNGSIDWMTIPKEVELKTNKRFLSAPVRLMNGRHSGANRGYGKAHIEAEHLKEIKNNGLSVEQYVYGILQNANAIYDRGDRLIVKSNKSPSGIAVVELRKDGDHYSVITAYKGNAEGKLIWSGRTASATQLSTSQSSRAAQQVFRGSNPPLEGLEGQINPDNTLQNEEGNTSSSKNPKTLFSKAPPTDSPAFKRWFGDSKVVDENGKPLVVYHGTTDEIQQFRSNKSTEKDAGWYGSGIYFAADPDTASAYSNYEKLLGKELSGSPNVIPVYLSIQNPYIWPKNRSAATSPEEASKIRNELESAGYDGVIVPNEYADQKYSSHYEVIAFRPEQIKSAIGNNGNYDPGNPDIRYSRAPTDGEPNQAPSGAFSFSGLPNARQIGRSYADWFGNFIKTNQKVNLWSKTVGTMYHLAHKVPEFRKVYEAGQDFLGETSRTAITAESLAPSLFRQMGSLKSAVKTGNASAKDVEAAAKAIFEGTLNNDGVLSAAKLKAKGLTDKQIGLYHQALAAAHQSLEDLGRSTIHRMASAFINKLSDVGVTPDRAMLDRAKEDTLTAEDFLADLKSSFINEMHENLTYQINDLQQQLDGLDGRSREAKQIAEVLERTQESLKQLEDFVKRVDAVAERIGSLKEEGYFPLMRFGKYTVDVTDAAGNRQFFSMYENEAEANQVAKAMREEFPGSEVSTGIASQEDWKVFPGLNPDVVESFARNSGADADQFFKAYVQLAVSNRSSLKRLLKRKGIPGYSKDLRRSLASFILANSRLSATNFHMGEMRKAVDAIPKKMGDVKDQAVRLMMYLQNPQEEFGALRGFMFFHFIGGSFASALTNLTQIPMVTLPYLTQYGGGATDLAKWASGKNPTSQQHKDALKRAEDEGIVSPQEVYNLMATARGGLGGAGKILSSTPGQIALHLWGSMFSMAEQYNRRLTFNAAYDLAVRKGIANPYEFAVKAVNETQFVYNRGNRPNWARGIGAPLFTFKQFSVSFLEAFSRMPTKQKLLMAALLVAAAGLEGLPFEEDLEDVIDTIAQWKGYAWSTRAELEKWSKAYLGKFFGSFLTRGVSGVGIPIDVQGRLGLGNLIPGTALFKPSELDPGKEAIDVLGAPGGLIKQAANAGQALARGEPWQAARALLPKAIQNMVQGVEMATTGQYKNAKGQKVADVDMRDAIAKGIGFQPTKVADIQKARNEVDSLVKLHQVTESGIANAWAQAILAHDQAGVREAKNQLSEWNSKNPDMPILINKNQIISRVKALNMNQDARYLKTVPPEIRRQVGKTMRGE